MHNLKSATLLYIEPSGHGVMPYCAKCGSSVDPNALFCPRCGSPVDMSATQQTLAPPPFTPSTYTTPPVQPAGRPTGVTILAILQGIAGLVLFLASLAFFVIGAAGSAVAGSLGGGITGAIVGVVATVVGVVFLIIALISFAVMYAFWTGKSWGWWVGLILAVIQVLLGIISLPTGVVSLAIGIIILYYLTRPHVKIWFHEA